MPGPAAYIGWRKEGPMPEHNQPKVADALNALLADSFALYLKTKNYHWHVQGPRFRELHLLFDEQATQILARRPT
jgi:starvation-inducible DNA-binding protein